VCFQIEQRGCFQPRAESRANPPSLETSARLGELREDRWDVSLSLSTVERRTDTHLVPHWEDSKEQSSSK